MGWPIVRAETLILMEVLDGIVTQPRRRAEWSATAVPTPPTWRTGRNKRQKMIAQSRKPELRLLAYQIFIPPTRNSVERYRHLAVSQRLSCETEPIDLVVLPELSSIEYSREAFDALGVLAEPFDGPSFMTWRAVAQRFGVTIAYGLPVFNEALLQITQVVVGPNGERRGAYAKLHTAQFGASMEKEFFSSGDHILVFNVAGFGSHRSFATIFEYRSLAAHCASTMA
ncbi:carbon-nitrogen hydrolase family protein [Mesorhizobium sp. M0306]|uniref:carbon-nitrogen hydrolase family protein n=1 Tax=Mesorhizobium sp. M0306 TaxID=2956932 RepID=UPI00333AF5CC